MPELPEVETTCNGIKPHITQQTIEKIIIRQPRLRWPIDNSLKRTLKQQTITGVSRRAKYVLIHTSQGALIIHLGMSGCLKIVTQNEPIIKHDHYDIILPAVILRYNDPRRFGSLHYTEAPLSKHKLLTHLGPEPLSTDFNAEYLQQRAAKSSSAIKTFLMNQKVVVGVGNIYASEALFSAGINPKRAAKQISLARYTLLVDAIKNILDKSIQAGGTTLKDFYASDGKPGYFSQELNVYGRAGEACLSCQHEIKKIILGQRSSFYCTHCQT
jgi:formamidopyrimidine-DNA glycosylase